MLFWGGLGFGVVWGVPPGNYAPGGVLDYEQ